MIITKCDRDATRVTFGADLLGLGTNGRAVKDAVNNPDSCETPTVPQ